MECASLQVIENIPAHERCVIYANHTRELSGNTFLWKAEMCSSVQRVSIEFQEFCTCQALGRHLVVYKVLLPLGMRKRKELGELPVCPGTSGRCPLSRG